MSAYPNPLIPGFNPDPSVVRVGDDFYLATSTFEYLPGVPIYHSHDFVTWTLIGNVATRVGQFDVEKVPTAGGAWAPTIRHRDGVFHLVITDAFVPTHRLVRVTDIYKGTAPGAALHDSDTYRWPMVPALALLAAMPPILQALIDAGSGPMREP